MANGAGFATGSEAGITGRPRKRKKKEEEEAPATFTPARESRSTPEERLARVEKASKGTLPSRMSLTAMESTLPERELERTMRTVAHKISVPPAYLFGNTRYADYSDPIWGGPVRLQTLQRMAGEVSPELVLMLAAKYADKKSGVVRLPGLDEVLESRLGAMVVSTGVKAAATQPGPEEFPTGKKARPTIPALSAQRIADTMTSLGRVFGKHLTLGEALVIATDLARRGAEPEMLLQNLRTVDRWATSTNQYTAKQMVHGVPKRLARPFTRMDAIGLAGKAASLGVPFDGPVDVSNWLNPDLAAREAQRQELRQTAAGIPNYFGTGAPPQVQRPTTPEATVIRAAAFFPAPVAARIAEKEFDLTGIQAQADNWPKIAAGLHEDIQMQSSAWQKEWWGQIFMGAIDVLDGMANSGGAMFNNVVAGSADVMGFDQAAEKGYRDTIEILEGDESLYDSLRENFGFPVWVAGAAQGMVWWYSDPFLMGGKVLRLLRAAKTAPGLLVKRTGLIESMVFPDLGAARAARITGGVSRTVRAAQGGMTDLLKSVVGGDRLVSRLATSEALDRIGRKYAEKEARALLPRHEVFRDVVTAYAEVKARQLASVVDNELEWTRNLRRDRTFTSEQSAWDDTYMGMLRETVVPLRGAARQAVLRQGIIAHFTFTAPPGSMIERLLQSRQSVAEQVRKTLQVTPPEQFGSVELGEGIGEILPGTALDSLVTEQGKRAIQAARLVDEAIDRIATDSWTMRWEAPLRLEVPVEMTRIPGRGGVRRAMMTVGERLSHTEVGRKAIRLVNVNAGVVNALEGGTDVVQRQARLNARRWGRFSDPQIKEWESRIAIAMRPGNPHKEGMLQSVFREIDTQGARLTAKRVGITDREVVDDMVLGLREAGGQRREEMFAVIDDEMVRRAAKEVGVEVPSRIRRVIASSQLENFYIGIDPVHFQRMVRRVKNEADDMARKYTKKARKTPGTTPVVFRGTPVKATKRGPGIFFSEKRQVAEAYAKSAFKEVQGKFETVAARLNITNPARLTAKEGIGLSADDVTRLKAEGFDGVTYVGSPGTPRENRVWVAFDEAQVRPIGEEPSLTVARMRTIAEKGAWREARDDAVRFWKWGAVSRPAYIFRVVLGEELMRQFAVGVGLWEWVTAAELRGRLIGGVGGLLPKGKRLGDIADAARMGERRFTLLDEAGNAIDDVVLPRPGSTPREPLADALVDRKQLAQGLMTNIERRLRGFGFRGRWDEIVPGEGKRHLDAWEHGLNRQLGESDAGKVALQSIAQQRNLRETVDDLEAWAKTPLGAAEITRIGVPKTAEEIRFWAAEMATWAHSYTVGNADIARLAGLRAVTADDLGRWVAKENRPSVHGPAVDKLTGRYVGTDKGFVDWTYKWFVRNPENILNRQRFYRVWRARAEDTHYAMFRAEQEAARLAGRPIPQMTEPMQEAIKDAAKEFALAQNKKIMFDFTENTRVGEMVAWAVPFTQPYIENLAVWGHILVSRNPAMLGYVSVAGRAASESGFVSRDDQGRLVIPMSMWLLGAPLLALAFGSGSSGWQLSAPLSSLNLFWNSAFEVGQFPVPVPSLAPWAGFPLQKFFEDTTNPSLRSWLFRYGPASDSFGGFMRDSLLPTWMGEALTSALVSLGVDMPSLDKFRNGLVTDFLRLQQDQGHVPNGETAKRQADMYAPLELLFSLLWPTRPIVRFPFAEIEDEYLALRDRYPDNPDLVRDMFLTKYPEHSLITISKTVSNRIVGAEELGPELGIRAPRVPPTEFAGTLLNTPGFKEFAQTHPAWAASVIVSSTGEEIDFGVFAQQVQSGEIRYRTPEETILADQAAKAWPAIHAIDKQYDVAFDRLRARGISDDNADWIDLKAEQEQDLAEVFNTYKVFGAAYMVPSRFSTDGDVVAAEVRFNTALGKAKPIVDAEVRQLLQSKLFTSFPVGKAVKEYVDARDALENKMSKKGVINITDPLAIELGFAEEYEDLVERLSRVDGFTQFHQAFFDDDLKDVENIGDRITRKWMESNDPRWQRFKEVDRRQEEIWDIATQEGLSQTERNVAFQRHRDYMDHVWETEGKKFSGVWWNSKSASEKAQYEYSLATRPLIFMSRWDLNLLGLNISEKATAALSKYGKGRIAITRDEEILGKDIDKTARYNALDKALVEAAKGDKSLREFIRRANTWGWQLDALGYTKGQANSAQAWKSLLDTVRQFQGIADAQDWHGSDPGFPGGKQWAEMKGVLRDFLEGPGAATGLFEWSPQFEKEFLDLQSAYQAPLLDLLVPPTYFALGGGAFGKVSDEEKREKKAEEKKGKAKAGVETKRTSPGGGTSGSEPAFPVPQGRRATAGLPPPGTKAKLGPGSQSFITGREPTAKVHEESRLFVFEDGSTTWQDVYGNQYPMPVPEQYARQMVERGTDETGDFRGSEGMKFDRLPKPLQEYIRRTLRKQFGVDLSGNRISKEEVF